MLLLARIPDTGCTPPDANNWEIIASNHLSLALSDVGIDFIHVSSGALMVVQKVVLGPEYIIPFVEAIKKPLEKSGRSEKTKVVAVGVQRGRKI
jgi:hypothetical protein